MISHPYACQKLESDSTECGWEWREMFISCIVICLIGTEHAQGDTDTCIDSLFVIMKTRSKPNGQGNGLTKL